MDIKEKIAQDMTNLKSMAEEKLKTYDSALVGEGWVLVRGGLLQNIEGNMSKPTTQLTGYSMFDESSAKKIAGKIAYTEAMHIKKYLENLIKELDSSLLLLSSFHVSAD